jgi:hypothetical protein
MMGCSVMVMIFALQESVITIMTPVRNFRRIFCVMKQTIVAIAMQMISVMMGFSVMVMRPVIVLRKELPVTVIPDI